MHYGCVWNSMLIIQCQHEDFCLVHYVWCFDVLFNENVHFTRLTSWSGNVLRASSSPQCLAHGPMTSDSLSFRDIIVYNHISMVKWMRKYQDRSRSQKRARHFQSFCQSFSTLRKSNNIVFFVGWQEKLELFYLFLANGVAHG